MRPNLLQRGILYARAAHRKRSGSLLLLALLPVLLLGTTSGLAARAQGQGDVQELTGQIDPGVVIFYDLPDLERGQTVYVYAEGTGGNLDPFVAITDTTLDRSEVRRVFGTRLRQEIEAGRDPVEVLVELADEITLAWNDDGGQDYDARLGFTAPADGDYRLLVASTPVKPSSGPYRLLVGVNAPDVLTGEAAPNSRIAIARLNSEASELNVAVQEITGTLTLADPDTFFELTNIAANDVLYAYLETPAEDSAPRLILFDYGSKALKTGNFSGRQPQATLEYTFEEAAVNHHLVIEACCDEEPVAGGDYRLLLGVNNPDVLTGQAEPTGRPVIDQPNLVKVGIKLDQITGVDQRSENFGVVADLRMDWTDPRLAFSPDTCQCSFQTFNVNGFLAFLAEQGVNEWPSFTVFNQQGRRDSQSQVVVVRQNGEATYVERFSATLQAPDFDFRRFPFDQQEFFIRIRATFPEEFFVYTDLEGFSGLGEQLGEEEWIITDPDASVDTQNNSTRFSFGFKAHRHLNFYIFRIFVPVLVIIIVSWITFFLKDYGKRVDVASANLLLFIAFNFTISNDLPRLGYLTLMDIILISTFVVTALVVVINVYLKRLEVNDKQEFADRIDRYLIWVYPVAYFVAFGLVTIFFT